MLHHLPVRRIENKEGYFMFTYTFLGFLLFFIKKFVFIIFISFFVEASNFRNRKLNNQKQELGIRNCQWNCMSMSVNSNLNSSNLKARELMLRLPMITLLTF